MSLFTQIFMHIFDARFAAYLAVAAVLIMTPGPDTALVTRNALGAGQRAAIFTTLGVGVGSIVWAFASVFGVAVLLEDSATIFTAWKIVGAAYLIFLGLRGLLGVVRGAGARNTEGSSATPALPGQSLRAWDAFRQGLLNNLLNPKAGAIFATALPQFIAPGDSPARLVMMLVTYEVILLCWLTLYGAIISRAGRSRYASRIRTGLEGVAGIVLIALGVRLAFERR